MKVILISAVWLCVTSFVAAQNRSSADIVIGIDELGGYGRYPIFKAEIFSDRTVVYKGLHFVPVEGERRFKLSKRQLKDLLAAFEEIDFFSLKDEYRADETGRAFSNYPTTITTFWSGGKQKRVLNYYGAPKALNDLEERLQFMLFSEAARAKKIDRR